MRGTAQNPDVFFQAREASNTYYDAVPSAVEEVFAELAELTGRRYGLVDYEGAPDAERVIVMMGSGSGAVGETVAKLVADRREGRARHDPPVPSVPDRGAAGGTAHHGQLDRRARSHEGAGRGR